MEFNDTRSTPEHPADFFGSGAGGDRARMTEIDGFMMPEAPRDLDDTDMDPEILADLALKLACTTPHLTTDWAAEQLCLPMPLVAELFEHLRTEKLVEILGESGPFSYRFAATNLGHDRCARILAINGYVGPAPVSLLSYVSMLKWQFDRLPDVSADDVAGAISDLVLPEHAIRIAGLAASARRSLFLNGPPGSGKTSLGSLLHRALRGNLWIPHCIAIDNHVIRVYDTQTHQVADAAIPERAQQIVDRRWMFVKRPLVVVGGELTLDALDLIYDPARGYYEAPLHFKANGGIFLLDDFGCQRAEPHELLNRWIIPLDRQVDFLTLRTGQKIQVPFEQMLIVSTNIDPDEVMAPALLRRMGYRLYMGNPSQDDYGRIFMQYAASHGIDTPTQLLDWLLERYVAQDRPLSCCEPRNLIERVRDICKYEGRATVLNEETLTLAWQGYFGRDGETPA